MADTYDVTNVTKTVYAQPGRPAGPAMAVEFETKPSGLHGQVIIPQEKFNVDEVRTAVTAAADVLEKVKAL